jgi:hypothetical protein
MASNSTESKKRISHATPKGSLLFAHLVSPDFGTEKYPNPEGSFSVNLILSAAESDKLKAKLADEIAEAKELTKERFASLKPAVRAKFGKPNFSDLCVEEYDKNDEPTGNYRWRFKTAAFVTDRNTGRKRERSVPVFDSMNQKVTLKEEPGNGSVAKVSFVASPYFVDGQAMGGLSLYLNAVQIIKLNKAGERSAEDYGFAEEEDGFVCSNTKTANDDIEGLTSATSSGSEANYEEPDF